MRPLEGLRVLDLTRLLPGGYCTMLLADLGADVLKVEEPGKGDYVRWMPPFHGDISAGHMALNRGKRSMTLNLKDARGVEVLKRLVRDADVLVESFRPGVMERLGAGYEVLAAENPALVYCAITGYGQDGPYAARAGHDANYLGYAGVTDINGPHDGPPTMIGTQIADIGGGALMAAVGILAAVQGRGPSGAGRFVDISMTDGALSWIGFHIQRTFFDGAPLVRGRGYISGGLACYRLYECGDGRWAALGALEPQFWRAFCEAVGLSDLISTQMAESQAEQDAMAARVAEVLATKPREEWLALLEPLEACFAPVNTVAEALADPHILARGMIAEVATGAGPVSTIASPIRERGVKPGPYTAAPGFGEHTDEALRAAGLPADEIASLREGGVV